MIHWMEGYRDGKNAKNAQFEVKKYGLCCTVKCQRVWQKHLTDLQPIKQSLPYWVIRHPTVKFILVSML